MPERDVKPGTDVLVTITGTVESRSTATGTLTIRTVDGRTAIVQQSVDVSIVTVEPEQPTAADVIGDHALRNMVEHAHLRSPDFDAYAARCRCGDTTVAGSVEAALRWHAEHVAAELLAAGRTR